MNKALQHLTSIKAEYTDFEIHGEKYKAKSLTGDEYKRYQQEIVTFDGDKREFHAEEVIQALIFEALCDDEGNRVFGRTDRALVGTLPNTLLTEIFPFVAAANGVGVTKDKTAKNLKAIQKD